MKALVKTRPEPGAVEWIERPDPRPGADDIVVQIKGSGVCGTDVLLHDWTYRGRAPVVPPIVLGHEGAGVVAAAGENVRGLRVGDRVGLEAIIGCGYCKNCLRGMMYLCRDWKHLGISLDGTFAEYAVVPAAGAHLLPDSVSFDDAAFLEPIAIIAHAFERVRPAAGESVVVVGPGALGLFATMAAKAAGAAPLIVVGTPADEGRLATARKLGADHVVNAAAGDAMSAVLELTGGLGADVVLEAGGTPDSVQNAISMCASAGRVGLMGFARTATFDPLWVVRQDVTIAGVVASAPRHYVTALDWINHRLVRPMDMVTHRLPMAEAGQGIELVRNRAASKVLLVGQR